MKITTGERLKEYLQLHGLRQADLVAAMQPLCLRDGIKMNRSDVSQYISGKVEPRQEKLILLSEAMGVDVAWLMGYDVPMYPVAHSQAEVISFNLQDAQAQGFYHLSEEELALLQAYRNAETPYRSVALELLTSHPKV